MVMNILYVHTHVHTPRNDNDRDINISRNMTGMTGRTEEIARQAGDYNATN